jgi:hypothetical protein
VMVGGERGDEVVLAVTLVTNLVTVT